MRTWPSARRETARTLGGLNETARTRRLGRAPRGRRGPSTFMIESRRPASRSRAARLAIAALAVVAAAAAFASRGEAADAPPDFGHFREKIEPVLQSVCVQCHAGKGKGAFALMARARGKVVTEAESRKDFETVLKLLVPGKPMQSKFLLKPLAEKDGGVKHQGGDRIFKGTPAYKAWVDFIEGTKGTGSKSTSAPAAPAAALASSAPGQPDFGF